MSRSYRRALIAVVLVAGLIVAWPAIFSSVGAFAAPAITFAHINDVYEIDPIEGGSYGGMARVATLFDRLRRAGPLVTTLGGDFLSPSAIGTARVNGEPLFGKQMVDVMNEVGLGFATLGNHEFDIPESAFRARMAEAKFKVVISNAVDASGAQFSNTVDTAIAPIKIGSRIVRIGFIGLVLDYNRKPWVKYLPRPPKPRSRNWAARSTSSSRSRTRPRPTMRNWSKRFRKLISCSAATNMRTGTYGADVPLRRS
jgi:5'-nucleotidase